MCCGVGRRHSSDLERLWWGPVAEARLTPSLTTSILPYAAGAAIKKKKKKKKREGGTQTHAWCLFNWKCKQGVGVPCRRC